MATLQDLTQEIEVVAEGLAELLPDTIFVGGATVPFYLAKPEGEEVRITNDVDVVLHISSYLEYAKLEECLSQKGFIADMTSKVAIRKRFKGITVDIMPSDYSVWGFSNRWYPEGIERAIEIRLPSGKAIRIFSAPYFLGSKLEAHHNRAPSIDCSSDLEDILLILQGGRDFSDELAVASSDLRKFLTEQASLLLQLDELEFRHICDAYRVSPKRIRNALGLLIK